jgi:hypothetical protein
MLTQQNRKQIFGSAKGERCSHYGQLQITAVNPIIREEKTIGFPGIVV